MSNWATEVQGYIPVLKMRLAEIDNDLQQKEADLEFAKSNMRKASDLMDQLNTDIAHFKEVRKHVQWLINSEPKE